jgi:hypothetical protein
VDNLDNLDDIYNGFKPLDTIFEHKKYEDIKKLLDVHFLGLEETNIPSNEPMQEENEEFDNSQNTIKQQKPSTVVEEESDFLDADAKIQEILKDL